MWLLALALLLAGSVRAQATLPDVLTAPDCPAACFLGIVPESTTRADVQRIFDEQGITFQSEPLGLGGTVVLYLFDASALSPHIAGGDGSGAVMVGTATALEISLMLVDVSVGDVIEWYGVPTIITADGQMAYRDEGLVFSISDEDDESVTMVRIRSAGARGSIRYFLSLPACDESDPLCSIPTATRTAPVFVTNTPRPTPTPLPFSFATNTPSAP